MDQSTYAPPSKDTHFLVTGGGKGITAENVVRLAKAYQSRFTLIGRSAILPEEPNWAIGVGEEDELKKSALEFYKNASKKVTPKEISREVNRVLSSREIQQTINRISEAGGMAEYVQADITNPAEIKQKIDGLKKDINALLHGAGALADKYIEDKTEDDFDLVYGVKVRGLQNILDLFSIDQLKYIVFFSSVAGFYGNAGQADYSLSNEILNKLAHHLKLSHPAIQILSIGWGPWDGGMVSPQLKRILTRKNVPLISIDEGTQALVNLLEKPQINPQWVIGNPLPFPAPKPKEELNQYRITRRLTLKDNPFLLDHVIGGNPVLPTVCAVAWFINSCEALYPGYHFFSVADYKVFKGIVFNDESPLDYLLELKEIVKNSETIRIEGKISSETNNGKTRYHYQAIVELRKKIPERPKIEDYDLSIEDPILGETLYENKVLFHGPSFRGIQQVLNLSEKGMTTECKYKSLPSKDMGQFPIKAYNPYLADVHLQSLLIWAHHRKGSLGLPLQIAGGIQYREVPDGEATYATMRMKKVNSHKLIADVISHDENGNVFMEVLSAEITLNENLYDLFQDNQLEKEPEWI